MPQTSRHPTFPVRLFLKLLIRRKPRYWMPFASLDEVYILSDGEVSLRWPPTKKCN